MLTVVCRVRVKNKFNRRLPNIEPQNLEVVAVLLRIYFVIWTSTFVTLRLKTSGRMIPYPYFKRLPPAATEPKAVFK